MRIAILTYPAVGHMVPVMKIARDLTRAGNHVDFFGNPGGAAFVLSQGFRFHAIKDRAGQKRGLAPLHSLPKWISRYSSALDRWIDALRSEIVEQISISEPDWVLADSVLSFGCLGFRKRGIRLGFYTTTVSARPRPGIPPYSSSWLGHTEGLGTRIRSRAAWFAMRTARLAGQCAGTHTYPPWLLVRRVARAAGWSAREIVHQRCASIALRGVPEFVLAPRAFTPGASSAGDEYYAGPNIDPERRQFGCDAAFSKWNCAELERELCTRPVVLAVFGSLSFRYSALPDFLRKLVIAADGAPWTLWIAAGCRRHEVTSNGLKNVRVFADIPQTWALPRCAAFVSHGGLNSIVEAILAHAPLAIFPTDPYTDQPGNAARVVHLGLGVAGSLTGDRADEIRAKIDQLIVKPEYRRRVQAFAASIRLQPEFNAGATVITRIMSQL